MTPAASLKSESCPPKPKVAPHGLVRVRVRVRVRVEVRARVRVRG